MMNSSTGTLLDKALSRTQSINFWHTKSEVESWPANRLLELARACAFWLDQEGIRPGDRVAICIPTSPELVAAIIAIWGCGGVVTVLPYVVPTATDKPKHKLNEILLMVAPKLLIHDELMPESVTGLIQQRLSRDEIKQLLGMSSGHKTFPAHPRCDDPAVIQLTSGSTGLPKGVLLTHGQVAANCEAIQTRVCMDSTDHMVSWLPLNHDMGLSAITVPLWSDCQLTLIRPDQFVRSPMTWLEAISTQRGTVSPNPAFAYALLAKFGRRLARSNIDLSSWRYAWVGAEPVFDKHLKSFTEAMQPFGLRDNVLKPAFGLAEAVVAVTCTHPDQAYRTLHVDGNFYRGQRQINVCSSDTEGALPFVSNGMPLDNMQVRIVDDLGIDLGEAKEGRVWIKGASVASGYLGTEDFSQLVRDAWLDTGDLGFLVDGELYISGRTKDLIIRGGVNTPPQHVEWAVEKFLGLRPSQVAAFSVLDTANAQEKVVLLVGAKAAPADENDLGTQVARVAAEEVGIQVDHVVFIAGSRLPKTTSGKVQRSLAKALYLAGEFAPEGMEIR